MKAKEKPKAAEKKNRKWHVYHDPRFGHQLSFKAGPFDSEEEALAFARKLGYANYRIEGEDAPQAQEATSPVEPATPGIEADSMENEALSL